MRLSKSVEIKDPNTRQRLIAWAGKYEVFCILNSNREKQSFEDTYSGFDFLVAVGTVDEIGDWMLEARSWNQENGTKNQEPGTWNLNKYTSFDHLDDFYQSKLDWIFGFLTYDLKNEIEHLSSENPDRIEFPSMHFFQPRLVLCFENGMLKIDYLPSHDDDLSIQQYLDEIFKTEMNDESDFHAVVRPAVSKEEYISTVHKIKQHIQHGDIYEMNYCVEFFAEGANIVPETIYHQMNELSPMPFSCFYRMNNRYLACASPERFLAKRGNKIISQPIKGTAKREKNHQEDERIRMQLKNDPKEQSENVMIVDLVRNDLSRTAKKGSVTVEELFGIYTFRQLHQMVSTVTSEMREDVSFSDVIKNAFPMGSMTGAPKVSAMQLIEEFENNKRGLYSGSVGYMSPDGDSDFNVVIRSILYHSEKKQLSFMVGSAITANSVAEKEYDECLLKAKAMLSVLKQSLPATDNQSSSLWICFSNLLLL